MTASSGTASPTPHHSGTASPGTASPRDRITVDITTVGITTVGITANVFDKFDDECLNHAEKTIKRIFFGINANGVLHTAVNEGNYEKVQQILDYRVTALEEFNRDGYTALMLACEKNDLKMVQLLLKYYSNNQDKVNINLTSKKGDHVLHTACKVSKIDNKILEELLNFPGIDVTAKISYDNTTPLHYFCAYNHSWECQQIGELFFKNGASVNATTVQTETPLHKAIFNTTVRVLMVKMLLAHNASPDIKGGQIGDTPLHYAIRLARPDLVEPLLAAGGDMSIKNAVGLDALEVAMSEVNLDKAKEGQTVEIIRMLKDVAALNNLLKSADALDLAPGFITEKMYSPVVLSNLTESDLNSVSFEIKMGQKIKLMQRLETYKLELAQQAEAEKAQQEAARAAQKKEEVDALLKGRGEHHLAAEDLRHTLQLNINDKWEIPVDAIEFTEKLGSGASGQVFKGLYQHQEVAIKVLNATDFDNQLEEFRKEFDILRKVNSPYMITFYGAVIERNLCMVMELCERGSLYDVLLKTPKHGWERLLGFARDMAEGIAVLHNLEEPIIHRDLKSLNLLVTKDWKVKVCDFGLSRSVNRNNLETFKKLRGTFAYCAPEVFKGESCTAKSDVFSMGICIWELLHVGVHNKYEAPYAEYGLHIDYQIIIQTAQGLRPTIPIGSPLDLVDVYFNCVKPEAGERPTAAQVASHIQKTMLSFRDDPSFWLSNTYDESHKLLYTFETTSHFALGNSQPVEQPKAVFKGWGNKSVDSSAGSGGAGAGAGGGGGGFKGWGSKEPPERATNGNSLSGSVGPLTAGSMNDSGSSSISAVGSFGSSLGSNSNTEPEELKARNRGGSRTPKMNQSSGVTSKRTTTKK
eukprot:TRINITY_DN3061_c1_g1_i1.p1 TRINITY_DN3061_c1_g1~~TRINITY_DN3061_c1_g1_i1.p1  ORF type:complete len:866 (+),score=190.17 TRINITY_DN3061_c1_g1_i1:441-3038(+)